MHSFNLIAGLFLSNCVSFTVAAVPNQAEPFPLILKEAAPPPGYKQGLATQDFELLGKKSICHTNCGLPGDNLGNGLMAEGVYAAAIGPMGGDSTDCFPCGSCYAVRNSGSPYCKVGDPKCPAGVFPGPDNQVGTQEIKIMIVNHCMDCDKVPGHFDINESPGWDNPKIWWKELPASECLK
ncbi:MAG: hypothetical protein LQ348_001331 [Seirophora lacunosa]|nr:MAG: hypothetical protein LQ348_001331 [Seirophora lacunosa]